MNKKFHIYFNLLLFFTVAAPNIALYAKIIEVDTFRELEKSASKDALILVDLDNCLFEGQTCYGHANWFYHHTAEAVKKGQTKDQARSEFYPRWIKSQKVATMKLIDPDASMIIQDLQDRGYTVMGFTHRRPSVRFETLRQIEQLNIDFSRNNISVDEIIFPYKHSPTYLNGILFISDYNEKGEVLMHFLKYIQMQPKKVVFIDDGLEHLQSVEEELKRTPIEFTGLHFQPNQSETQEWDFALADIQEMMNGKILSNEATQFLLNKTP